jgi:fructose-specific phosphotransferase system IIA component
MRLSEILQPGCVKVPLEAGQKHDAIDELVDLLAGEKLVDDPEPLKAAVHEREQTRTTGIGHGIAIPHGKSEGIDQLRCAIGKPAQPLDFGAIDGQPVDLIILLASPVDQTGPHIQALAKISRMLTEESFRSALKQADSAKTLYDQIVAYEGQVTV